MLYHVYEKIKQSELFEDIVIATDDDRIANAAKSWNAWVIMTSPLHQTGTERCEEAYTLLNKEYDIVLNIQGDEPFISREPLSQLNGLFSDQKVGIATLIQRINSLADLENTNIVKTVVRKNKQAIYFSRAPLPYLRDFSKEDWIDKIPFWKHIGIYGFRPAVLNEIVKLSPSQLEMAEKLEQLRWLDYGFEIFTEETTYQTLSVDTPDDLNKAENFYKVNTV